MKQTNYLAEALESIENSITEGKEYKIFVVGGTEYVKDDNNNLVLLSFKHKEWIDESSDDYKEFLLDFIETRLKDSKRSKTASSLREILDLHKCQDTEE